MLSECISYVLPGFVVTFPGFFMEMETGTVLFSTFYAIFFIFSFNLVYDIIKKIILLGRSYFEKIQFQKKK